MSIFHIKSCKSSMVEKNEQVDNKETINVFRGHLHIIMFVCFSNRI